MRDTAKDQAIAQVKSIARMVAALDLDYDRLQELRELKEEREPLAEGVEDAEARHAAACRSYASSTNEQNALKDAQADLQAWDEENAEEMAELAELESIAGNFESADDAQEAIQEDPLSVEVRSDWCAPGEKMTAGEFRILLCTGGPHVELVGDLDQWSQPSRVRVIYKDWGESGELFDFDHDAVLRYCQQFYFGE